MNIERYLQRIGWSGPVSPTPEDLAALANHHARAVPFENLNPFLGLTVDLAIDALERKIVDGRRGGYCFEQNLLLGEALRSLGFEASGLAARVLWNQPEDALMPRSHMLLRVDFGDDIYVVDVGFGALTLTGALRLVPGLEQATPHEVFRLVEADGEWRMQARVRDEWRSLYRFDLQRQYPQDYVAANYYLSTNPASHFVTGLIAARPTQDGRYTLLNRDFAFHRLGGPTERRRLESERDLIDALNTSFGIDTAGLPGLAERLRVLP